MTRERAWYRGREPITVNLETEGQLHRVSWQAGHLILHDHDVAAEEVLMALGGQPCACLLVRNALRGRLDDNAVGTGWRNAGRVGLGSRHTRLSAVVAGGPSLRAAQQLQALQSNAHFQGLPTPQRQQIMAQFHHQLVLEIISEPMAELLEEAGTIRWWRRTRRAPSERPKWRSRDQLLSASVVPAIERAVVESRAHRRADAELTIQCWRQPPGTPPHVAGQVGKRGGFVSVGVCLSWLNRVWLRGLANVGGYFVLDVDAPSPACELRGVAVRWIRHAGGDSVPVPTPCWLFRRGRRWSLAWC